MAIQQKHSRINRLRPGGTMTRRFAALFACHRFDRGHRRARFCTELSDGPDPHSGRVWPRLDRRHSGAAGRQAYGAGLRPAGGGRKPARQFLDDRGRDCRPRRARRLHAVHGDGRADAQSGDDQIGVSILSKQMEPVALLGVVPNMLVAHPDVAAKSVKELVALAKNKAGRPDLRHLGRRAPRAIWRRNCSTRRPAPRSWRCITRAAAIRR